MKRFVGLLVLLSAQLVHAQLSEKDLVGTWLTVSHQTVTVTHYKEDGTFSGTYFTPAFDVRTAFSGKWTLQKDELTLKYLESTSLVMRVPLEDKNRLTLKDKDTILFQTLPAGVQVEVNRVKFKDRKEVYGQSQSQ